MRLGVHSEQEFFVTNPDKYDVIVINANLAQYFSSGTATLLSYKLKNKRYIIDPLTHAFGHDPQYFTTPKNNEEPAKVKSSIEGLAIEYGTPIYEAISGLRPQRVSNKDFFSQHVVDSFVERVINFQKNYLVNSIASEDKKYLEVDFAKILKPLFFIAPYFYMKSSTVNEWLNLNLQMIEASKKFSGDDKLYSEIVIDRGLLENNNEIERIARSYLALDACDGYLLWISNLSEHRSILKTLSGMRRFISILAEARKPIINLYGGYFSLLLTKYGLTGVCHGPGYGEDRDVIPVGGGMPTSKFYLNPVHHRLLYGEVQLMVNGGLWPNAEAFYREVCSGTVCKEILSGDLQNFVKFGEQNYRESKGKTYGYPTTEARFLTTQHYLEAKAHEFKMVNEENLQDLIEQLKDAKAKYKPWESNTQLNYLDNWIKAIQ
jgi:hypothetical protein